MVVVLESAEAQKSTDENRMRTSSLASIMLDELFPYSKSQHLTGLLSLNYRGKIDICLLFPFRSFLFLYFFSIILFIGFELATREERSLQAHSPQR